MADPRRSPLRYLSSADVVAAMPDLAERLQLAERTLVGLVADAELPPKVAVHPRSPSSFAHAMPAYLRGQATDGSSDRLGIKWVTGYPSNPESGLQAIAATVILSDPVSGLPIAILDGGPITAERTAAVSGVALDRFGPRRGASAASVEPSRVAIIGAGVQGRSHLPVIGAVLPGAELRIFDRHPERAMALVRLAGETPGIAGAATAPTARAAVEGAAVVITAASFGPDRQVMTTDWLVDEATVVAIDYATYCSAEVAAGAGLFLVDDRGQFLANRDAGAFDDYPDPTAMLGEAILAGTPRPTGRVVVTHLGVGLADVIFGEAILRRAEELGRGLMLPR
jgi:ornithine cyclodeaminase/alanine dehydrogenase